MINRTKYIVLFLLLIFQTDTFGQAIKLEGKQFKNIDGTNFYPVVCNYMLNYAFDGSNYFIMPAIKYGSSGLIDCFTLTECQQRIQDDLHEMKLMGFNTVRFMGHEPQKSDYKYPAFVTYSDHFVVTYENFPNTTVWDGSTFGFLDIYEPYDNANTSLQTLFGQMDLLLSMADAEGMKVILITGGGNHLVNNISGTSSDNAADYTALLAAFGDHFKNSSTLLAFDLFNEPQWSEGGYFHKKEEICEWTKSWYDVLKNNDPNHHLVTMGLNNWNDVLEWDPGVMKLDFLSEHIYPGFAQFEGYSLAPGMNRYHDELVWLANNSPIPWIIGETGFVASATTNTPNPPDPTAYNYPPYVHGDENEQANFAELTQNEVRDAGGSGYSWWQFQDVHWFGSSNPDEYRQNWFGLLRYGNPGPAPVGYSSYRKPAITKFQAFDPTTVGTFPGPSASYYNPYNHPANPVGPAGQPTTITGHVQDQNGNPIKDAFVTGVTPIKFSTTHAGETDRDYHYTYTDFNGNFTLIPYDYDNIHDPASNNIEDFKISAIGCNRLERGWSSAMNPSSVGVITGQTYTLERSTFTFNANVDGETVTAGTSENFQGKNSLVVSNTSVQANAQSEFKAGSEINVHSEFHASAGSEVHIYTTEVFPECFDFNTYRSVNPTVSSSGEENYAYLSEGEIEVQFKKKPANFSFYVQPNPNNGRFILTMQDARKSDNWTASMNVYSVTGNKVYSSIVSAETTEIDLNHLGKGIYSIQLAYKNNLLIQKLIIQ